MGIGPWRRAHFTERKAKENRSRTGLGTRGGVWCVFCRKPSRRGAPLEKGQEGAHHVEGSGKIRGPGSCPSSLLLMMPEGSHSPVAVATRDFSFLTQTEAPSSRVERAPRRAPGEEHPPSLPRSLAPHPAGEDEPGPALPFPCRTAALQTPSHGEQNPATLLCSVPPDHSPHNVLGAGDPGYARPRPAGRGARGTSTRGQAHKASGARSAIKGIGDGDRSPRARVTLAWPWPPLSSRQSQLLPRGARPADLPTAACPGSSPAPGPAHSPHSAAT